LGRDDLLKPSTAFKAMLRAKGYSLKAVEEIWKWYDSSERRGVNFG